MANITIDKIRIPWEYFEKRMESEFVLYMDCGVTEEQFSEVKNGMRAKYDNGDFDISLNIDLVEKDK